MQKKIFPNWHYRTAYIQSAHIPSPWRSPAYMENLRSGNA